ncbi:MAG: LysR family transcriptional regulator [Bacteriovoracaceae bacterium]|nr:LysR family transcriptional regulator [Bacteriovoracaceae bacterium]
MTSSVWLNYHHLLYFKTIAETGSLAKASEILRVGQSALSMQLKILEDRLEQPLFERKQKKLVLTEAGQLALDYARQIFSLGDEMLDTLSDTKQAEKTHIQIGIEEGVPHYSATELLKSALKQPGASPSVSHGAAETLVQDLIEHRLDMVLLLEQAHIKDKTILFQRRVSHSPLFALASPEFAHLKKGFPASLGSQPLLLQSPLSRPRHEIERFFHENHLPVNLVLETDENTLLKNLAVAGKGVTCLTEGSAAHWVKSKELVVLGQLPVFLELWLVGPKRKMVNKIAQKLLKEFSLE